MKQIQVDLLCGHSVRVPFNTFDITIPVYCLFDGHQDVTTFYPKELHVICTDCQYGRWAGQSKEAATRAERLHARAKPAHRIIIVLDTLTRSGRGKILETYTREHLRTRTPTGNVVLSNTPN
jgi:acyl-CoA synthetase (AMP-forming)/AMP-acid ligase II